MVSKYSRAVSNQERIIVAPIQYVYICISMYGTFFVKAGLGSNLGSDSCVGEG